MNQDPPRPATASVSVRDLREARFRQMKLELLAADAGLDNRITSPRIQKLGLALAGYTDYLHPGRVQFVGRTELNFLKRLSSQAVAQACEGVFSRQLCCMIVTNGLDPPKALLERSNRCAVPLFQTRVVSSTAISEVTHFLEDRLAPSVSIHGVLVEVSGMGVLVLGESGIGKSECALELILRGHRLITDDVVVIRRIGHNVLEGMGPADFPHHMELRGLGIINIRDLFGVSALCGCKSIDLAVELVRWSKTDEYERLGLEEREYRVLDVAVPYLRMPVAPGRNVATLVEVAVRIRMLRAQGYASSSEELVRRLEARLRGDRE